MKHEVTAARSRIRSQFDAGANGLQLVTLATSEVDRFVSTAFEELVHRHPPDVQVALHQASSIVAVGGTGRSEVCPYSDIDLLFLFEPGIDSRWQHCVEQFVRDCWDAGVKLGHSVHTIADALKKTRTDIQFATSLVDARPIWGSTTQAVKLVNLFRRRVVRPRIGQFITECVSSRQKEREQYGATTQQLEPDIKRSLGGLRDLHLLRWIGYAKYGYSDLESLKLHNALSPDEAARLMQANDALLQIRVDLHLTSGKEQDLLTRDDQRRIAERRQIASTPGQLPVERFMTDYFRHSADIAEISRRFTVRNTAIPVISRAVNLLLNFRIDDVYRIGMQELSVPSRYQAQVLANLEGILRIYLTAARYRVMLDIKLEEKIKQRLATIGTGLSADAADLFMELLATPGTLGTLLRSMYATGLLEIILPCFRHVRYLLQFNQYHSYTVDEHTLLAVEAAERFALDSGLLGRAYRETRSKNLLFLAILLHDAGKGYVEDHSEVGRRLAEDAAARLGLTADNREMVSFLVHKHLVMAHLAFRRNANDPDILLPFSRDVGSPEGLRLLFLLTAADITAVGPDVWNKWKGDLLGTLYQSTLQLLTGQEDVLHPEARRDRVVTEVLDQILAQPGNSFDRQRLQKVADTLPDHYLFGTWPADIARDILVVVALQPGDIDIHGTYEQSTNTTEYRIIAEGSVGEGCFHKMTGALSSRGLEILSANICTTSEGVIIDVYSVIDHDHAGAIPEFRFTEIRQQLQKVLKGDTAVDQLFAARRRLDMSHSLRQISNLRPRVVINNDISDRFTVIDVFAQDRIGLLYQIARALYELALPVMIARISTHIDQVVDVFYVTDEAGLKIRNPLRLLSIQERLFDVITEGQPAAAEAGAAAGSPTDVPRPGEINLPASR